MKQGTDKQGLLIFNASQLQEVAGGGEEGGFKLLFLQV